MWWPRSGWPAVNLCSIAYLLCNTRSVSSSVGTLMSPPHKMKVLLPPWGLNQKHVWDGTWNTACTWSLSSLLWFIRPCLCHKLRGKRMSSDRKQTNLRHAVWVTQPCSSPHLLPPHPISFLCHKSSIVRVGVPAVIQGLKADIFPLYCGDVYMSLMCLVFLKSQWLHTAGHSLNQLIRPWQFLVFLSVNTDCLHFYYFLF